MSNHDDVNGAFAARLSVPGLKARLAAFYRDERLLFAVQGLGYFRQLPARLKASASRALPWIAVTAATCALVSCSI